MTTAAAIAVVAHHPGITVTFPGGKRVDAHIGSFTIATDQPAAGGGAESAPAPFDLFLASIATCAGIYALGFCQARGLSTEGLRLEQEVIDDPATHLPAHVILRVTPPIGFPARYRDALARAVDSCKVKKTIARGPAFAVELTAADA
ncbi:MAG: OsmC family protein [Myxococcales bacterium]|nr:OsmC family protein [Myxococcales bacterium]